MEVSRKELKITGYQYGGEEHDATMPRASGELAVAPDILPTLPAWPWPGSGQGSLPFHSTHNIQGFRAPATLWPSTSTSVGSQATPYPQITFPAPLGLTASAGVWHSLG